MSQDTTAVMFCKSLDLTVHLFSLICVSEVGWESWPIFWPLSYRQ